MDIENKGFTVDSIEDIDILFNIAKFDKQFAKYATQSLKVNPTFCLLAVKIHPISIMFFHPDIKNNFEIAHEVISIDGRMLCYISQALKKDLSIVKTACFNHPNSIFYADQSLKNNAELAKIVISRSGANINFFSEDIKSDPTFSMLAVSNDGMALEYLSDKMQDSVAIIWAAYQQNPQSLDHASPRIKEIIFKKINDNMEIVSILKEQLAIAQANAIKSNIISLLSQSHELAQIKKV